MSGLPDRVDSDLAELNRLARARLADTRAPVVGMWARCWDTRSETPVGQWHLVHDAGGEGEVRYRCGQVGIVTVLAAMLALGRLTIHQLRRMPEDGVCVDCKRFR